MGENDSINVYTVSDYSSPVGLSLHTYKYLREKPVTLLKELRVF